uniref:B1 homeodomain mating type protein n=1 Tax=Heterobasidion parviporum TaxID=207832 RepID=S5RF34_9AGAM|nr:b1 homeodomain mating type protein [Heterobasidion parviporum]
MTRGRLLRRFEKAQDALLSALVKGPSALSDFQKMWLRLSADYDQELHLNCVDDEVSTMAHATALIVSTLSGSFLKIDNATTDLRSSLIKRLEETLDSVDRSDDTTNNSSSPFPSVPLNQAALSWLIHNLHNPYPSPSIKEQIARSSQTSVQAVTSWFHNTREQIGWTTLAEHYFNGSRSAMVDAARQAFIEPDPTRLLPHNIEHAFLVVQQNAQRLSTDAYAVPQGSDRVQTGGPQNVPSLPSSPRALQLLEWDSSAEEEEDMTPPPPIAGCKRRAEVEPETDGPFQASIASGLRSIKRRRTDEYASISSTLKSTRVSQSQPSSRTSIPNPMLAASEVTLTTSPFPITSSMAVPDLSPTLIPVPTTSRKRRLSDARDDITPKRPRNSHSGPRMQAVSDPLPQSTIQIVPESALFDSWHQSSYITALEASKGKTFYSPSLTTTALNTPLLDVSCEVLPVVSPNLCIPLQYVDLSDEAFQAMLASGCDMSSEFITVDQGVVEMLPSLDDLFPPSSSDPSNSLLEQQNHAVNSGSKPAGTFQTQVYNPNDQLLHMSPSLSYHVPLLLDEISFLPHPSGIFSRDIAICDVVNVENTCSWELDDWTTSLFEDSLSCKIMFTYLWSRR